MASRSTRATLGKQTVEIVEQGRYQSANGVSVDISEAVQFCTSATRHITPDELRAIRQEALTLPPLPQSATIEVVNETTLQGITRLLTAGVPGSSIAALNFASAKNPGGGFLNGSQAQEESLARSSALYASQLTAWDYYESHRSMRSLLYTDAMILSPDCPIFRDDEGTLLDVPQLVSFITCAAPNAGAIANQQSAETQQIPGVFERRCEFVLALAAAQGYRHLVLGAWGCGVFRNDPALVASTFMNHLKRGLWHNRFERVVFSVLDHSPNQETFRAFEAAAGGTV